MSKQLAQVIEQTESRFQKIAPSFIKYDSEKGFAIQLIQNNDFLNQAVVESPASLQQALVNVAAIGLSLNPAEKLAYLIPRNVKVKENGVERWVKKVFLEPSYVGLIRLATDSGSLSWVQSVPVFSNDKFTDNGPGLRPTHEYDAFAKKEDRGKFVGVYCTAKAGDDYLTCIMTAEEIDNIKNRSETGKKGYGPWVSDFMEMAKKAVIRRAFKTWPRTNDSKLAQAVKLSDDNEGFEFISQTTPKIGQFNSEQKSYLDGLIEDNNGLGMYVFKESLIDGDVSGSGASVWISLAGSFPKGEKGKYGEIINNLVKSGKDRAEKIIADLEATASSGDEFGVKEIIEELLDDEYKFIATKLSHESMLFVDQVRKS